MTNEDVNVLNINNYRSQFGLPNGSISIVTDGNGANYGLDDTESTLDGEVSSAIAPGAKIVYYQAADTTFQSGVMLAILRAIEDDSVNILNVSYGGCELAQGTAGNQEVLNAWEQAAAQGIAVTVSSGDSGSAGCDDPNTQTVASHGFGVNALASTPYTVAIGGTDFDVLPNNFSKYASSTNSSSGTSALGYIPENPWNNSTKSNGTSPANQPFKDSDGNTNIAGGGGGASSASLYDANGNVLGGYTKPLWQQQYEINAGVSADQVRDLPDVSLFAANGFYRAAWAICLDSDCSGSAPTISGVGGTSASAPAFAGILALINQKIGATTRIGQPNWVLYNLAQTHPEAFHQITTGNNSVVCAPGSPNCAGNNFLSGFDAAASYNRATGLGSVDISNLVNVWTSVAKTQTQTQTQTTLSLTPTNVQHGQSVSMAVSINPSGATGNVAITTDANEQTGSIREDSQTSVTLSNGEASSNWLYFPGGTYNVYADYGGDGTYAGSVSTPMQLTVAPENSVVQLSVTVLDSNGKLTSLAAGGTAVYGAYISIDAQPIGQSQASSANPLRDATGTIAFYDGTPGTPGTVAIDASGNAESRSHGLPAGTHTITAAYSGDKSYKPSTSAAVTFTIQKDPTTVTMSSDSSSTYGQVVNLTATVNPAVPVSVLAMSGIVTITDLTNGIVLGTPIADSGRGLITIQSSQLAMGSNNIVATYSGDDNFAPSAQSGPVVVTCTAGCGNGTGQTLQLAFYPSTPASHIISAGTTSTTPVAVNPGGGFTGAVNLTCSVTGTKITDISIPQCSFNPATVTITDPNLAVQSTLAVMTTAPVTTAAVVPQGGLGPTTRYGLTFACLIFLGFSTRRKARGTLRAVLCLAVLGGIAACGGSTGPAPSNNSGGSGGSTTPGTTPDTYTITFYAADAATGTVTAQDYFTVQVN